MIGTTNGRAKLTEKEVLEIRAAAENNCELARRYLTTEQNIRAIRSGRSWKHLLPKEGIDNE